MLLPPTDSRTETSACAARTGAAPEPLTRRTLLGLVPPLIASSLTACKSGAPNPITVRFWNGFTGPDGRTMLHLVKRFNQENPDVNVLMQRMDWATYYNKLFVAGLGGRAPELFVLQTLAIPRFSTARFVRPIDDLIARPNSIDTRDIDDNVWQAVHIGENHYGLPLDIWPMGMYYNRKLFREAGIVDKRGEAKPPTNREEFMDALKRLTKASAGAEQWGFTFTFFESNAYSIMRQFGGEFFTPDASQCIINNPQNVAAIQFCVDLIRKYKYAPPPENFDSWIGFRQGKIGIVFEGVYMLADLQKQKDLDYAGAPVPLLGEKQAVWAGSHNLCLRSDLSGRELEASWRFVKFLSDNSLDWAAGGQVPVRRSLRNSDRFRAMTVQSEFARQIPYVNYLPRLQFIFEFQTEFNSAIEKALRGSSTPQDALDAAAANLNRIISRQRDSGAA